MAWSRIHAEDNSFILALAQDQALKPTTCQEGDGEEGEEDDEEEGDEGEEEEEAEGAAEGADKES